MKITRLLILLILPLLFSCNQASNNKGTLRPSAGTNPAAMANLNLGIEYMRLGEYEKSLEKLDRARAADPGFSGTYNAYGLLYQLLQRNQDAEKNFKKALKLNPNDSDTMNNYGRFLCQIQRSEEAERILLQAAANPLYATPEIAITNAGTCAFQEGRLDDAEKYFRRALESNEQNPTALLQMSQLSYDRKNYLSARGYLQRYLAVSRHNPASLWLGIQIENILGDQDALSSYKLSLKNNFPDSTEAGHLSEMNSAELNMSEEQVKQVQLTAGEQLRHMREQKNLSVNNVASQLNLDARIIESIEANDFESLPAATYARGYLRSYAKILKMDAEAILAAYNSEAPDPPEIIPEVKHSSQTSSSDKPVRAFTYLVSLTLVILLVAWLYSNYLIESDATQADNSVEQIDEAPVSALSYEVPVVRHSDQPFYRLIEIDEAESIEPGTTDNETSASNSAESEASNSESALDAEAYPDTVSTDLSGPDSLVLQLSRDSWIEIFDALDNKVFVNLGREGQVLNLNGTAPFSVVLGFAEGVKIEINGATFDTAPFTEGSIARFTIDN